MADTAHCVCVYRIMPRNGQDAFPIAHHNVLALTDDPKPCIFECPHSTLMIDPR